MNSTSAHNFPELNGDRLSKNRAVSRKDEGADFKPLYQSDRHCPQSLKAADASGAVDQVREKGYAQGFEAGCKDACLLVQQEITPAIRALSEGLIQLEGFVDDLAQNSAVHISKMALRIAEKILGEPPHLTMADLDFFADDLKHQMAESCRLDLLLNPDDKNNLTQLLAAENSQSSQAPSIITIKDGGDVQSGSLQAERDPRSLFFDDILSKSLSNILTKASTK